MRKLACLFTLWLTAFMIGLPLNVARADDAMVGAVGYGVMPLDNDQIEMVSEVVEVWLYGPSAEVEATFDFHNMGKATEVLMGFPQEKGREGRGDSPELEDFKAYVDGVEVEVTFKEQVEPRKGLDFAGWYTFKVAFAPGQTRVVRNTYRGAHTYVSDGCRFFNYVLRTGGLWKGPIGQADIIVHLQDGLSWENFNLLRVGGEFYSAVQPSGYHLVGDKILWHFEDMELTSGEFDITVGFVGKGFAAFSPIPSPAGRERLSYALDGDLQTTWVPRGAGIGQWVLWHDLPFVEQGQRQKQFAYGLGVLPGYASDLQLFHTYSRPREVKVLLAIAKDEFTDWGQLTIRSPQDFSQLFDSPPLDLVKTIEKRFALADESETQYLWFDDPLDLLAAKVVIEGLYPGREHEEVAITELEFPLAPKAWASSSLVTEEFWHTPNLVLDLDQATAWLTEGRGIEQWLELELPILRTVTGLALVNGYAKDEATFATYGRVRRASLVLSDGSRQTITLVDTTERQIVDFAPIATTSIKLVIEEVYPGTRNSQVALSEVQPLTNLPSTLPVTGGVSVPSSGRAGIQALGIAALLIVALTIRIFSQRRIQERL